MLRFVTKPKNKVTTIKQTPFLKNQNFISNKNRKYDGEFHSCMRNVMRLSRWFGLFPVEGLESTSWDKLKFNLKSFYGVIYVALIIGQIINVIVTLINIFESGATLSLFTNTVFYFNTLVSTLLLLRAARSWSMLVEKAAALEKASGIQINKHTSKKIVFVAYAMSIFCFVEHGFSTNYYIKYIIACYQKYSFSEIMAIYILSKMPYKIANSYFLQTISQIYLEISGKQGAFLWSFRDVLNICMSIYLTAYFEKLNKLIIAGKDKQSTNWRKLREQQGILAQLVDLMNEHFDYTVLASSCSNLYFLCVQLYNTFRTVAYDVLDCDPQGIADVLHGTDHYVYYFFSFTYLMFKTLMSSYTAASVNAAAREPLSALDDIHPSNYGIEVQRFFRQISYTTIGVSGVLFFITRPTILKVFGSVVTYELMLVQIYNRKHSSNLTAYDIVSTNMSNITMLSLYSDDNVSSLW